MAASNQPPDLEDVPDAIVDEAVKGFPVVWLLPLVALLVGGWLYYKTLSEKGPAITISFETAEGIEAGKTQIKFRDVTVGQVDDVDIADDLRTVVLTATMETGTAHYLTDASRFWVVKPRVGAGGVTGLGTLLSGAYIAFEPNTTGKKQKSFVGLEKPPIVSQDKEGSRYRLRTETLGSLSVGAPVYFRQFDIGEVTDYKLADDYSYVDVGIFVQSPYDDYVRERTHFWNVGGVSVSMDASGVKVEMESLVALLSGGIAFETLPEFTNSPAASPGTVFPLYKNRAESLERPITEVISYALKFTGTVRGLSIGAPVEYRGIRVGTVKNIMLGEDPQHEGVHSPVVIIGIEPQRTVGYRDVDDSEASGQVARALETSPRQRIAFLVEKGLRARLQTGSLLTGQLFVDLDIFPDAEPATVIAGGQYPQLPTLPSSMQSIIASVNKILDKIEQSDLEGTLTNLNALMVSTSSLMSSLERDVPGLARELDATLQAVSGTLATLDATVSADGEIGSQLQDALKEFGAAARSIRVMAEYLERHPEAMLKGKSGNP
ncbi:MAG: MlaD family protein [Pseudomonadota bacterium]|nr:MlaD family protein [Pseudomonadota bacterium]